jgi:hypothetical protein
VTLNWRGLAIAIVSAQFAAAMLVAAVAGFRYSIPVIEYWSAALGITLFGLCGYSLVMLVNFAKNDEPQPAKALAEATLRSDLPLVTFLVGSQLALLGWLKVTMPYAVGFWADPFLADADAFLFGGDPWRFLHRLPIGDVVDRVYVTWGPFCACSALALAFAPDDRRKGQCVVAYFLTVASAAFGQYLLPSAGPVFFEATGQGARFAELPIQPWVRTTADYLWETYSSPGFRVGSGISAWPSLHVAGATWMAITLRCYFPRSQIVGWTYFILILVGSVYLGWHYALDGLFGAASAVACFRLAKWLLSSSWAMPVGLIGNRA